MYNYAMTYRNQNQIYQNGKAKHCRREESTGIEILLSGKCAAKGEWHEQQLSIAFKSVASMDPNMRVKACKNESGTKHTAVYLQCSAASSFRFSARSAILHSAKNIAPWMIGMRKFKMISACNTNVHRKNNWHKSMVGVTRKGIAGTLNPLPMRGETPQGRLSMVQSNLLLGVKSITAVGILRAVPLRRRVHSIGETV